MTQKVEAIYEHGILRPLEPLVLTESQRVKLVISETSEANQMTRERTGNARLEMAVKTAPTIEEVREALSSIPGSLAEEVIASRGEY